MKVLYSNLPSYNIEKVVFNSLGQSLYQVIVVIDSIEHVVWEGEQKTLLRRNLMELREMFEVLKVPEKVLRQESPYDEMIGLGFNRGGNRMEVPLDANAYPASKSLN